MQERAAKPLIYGFGGDLFMGRSEIGEDGERWTMIPPLNNLAADKKSIIPGAARYLRAPRIRTRLV